MTDQSDSILERLMQLHPKVIDLSLDRLERLLGALGHPESAIPPVIHIAGTNGKGSTQAMIRAGLESAGKTLHAYTSPHLARFHERIRLAGTLIDEPTLAATLEDCERADQGQPITFFEITTAAAFLAFSRVPADYTLLEVGLGGRLDATNVITPKLSVITPVDLDHQDFLGDTLAKIAGEKAGIIKRGVPVIVAPQHDEALEVIEDRARRLGAPLFVHGQHWQVREERGRLIFEDETGLLDLPRPVLRGPHQIVNAGTAIAALRQLGFGEEAAEAACTRAQWPARMQRLRQGPLVDLAPSVELWLDGGHNPAAGEVIAQTLADMPARPTHLICGMLSTKDVAGYMRPMAAHGLSLSAVAIPGEKNTLPAAATARFAREAGFAEVFEAASVAQALAAIAAKDPSARVLICGSLYLAGTVLRENG